MHAELRVDLEAAKSEVEAFRCQAEGAQEDGFVDFDHVVCQDPLSRNAKMPCGLPTQEARQAQARAAAASRAWGR